MQGEISTLFDIIISKNRGEKLREYYPLFRLLFVAFIFLLFYNIGNYPVWNKDEGLYADAVRIMIENGNFLDPYFNYEHRWQKPILIYWVLLPFSYLFGADEFTIRLSLFFLALATLFITYLFAKKIFHNSQIAFLSSFFLLSSTAFILQSRHIVTHMLLLFTIMLSFYFLYDLLNKKRDKKTIIIFGASLGLVFLAKLYVGVVFILTTAFLLGFKEILKNKKEFIKGSVLALISFSLIAFPWYIYMYLKYDDLYINFLYHEFFDRIGTNVTGKNSPLFYVKIYLGNFAPWSVVFITLSIVYFKKFRGEIWQKLFQNKSLLLVLTAFLVVLITLSIPKSKLPGYLFSLQGFASILMAYAIYYATFNNIIKITFIFLQTILTIALIAIWILYFDYFSFEAITILFILIGLYFIKLKDIYRGILRLGVVVFLVYFTILGNIYKEIEPFFGYKRFAQEISQLVDKKDIKVYFYKDFRESVPFYAKTKIIKTSTLPTDSDYIMITDEKFIENFDLNYTIIDSSKYYKGSDSNVFKILNIQKGYRKSDRAGKLILIEVQK